MVFGYILIALALLVIWNVIMSKRYDKKKKLLREKTLADYHARINYTPEKLAEEKINTEITGVHIDNRRTFCEKLVGGEELLLEREPFNRYDKNAIKITNIDGQLLGYIPAEDARYLAPRIDNGETLMCYYSHTNRSGSKIYVKITLVVYK